MGLNGGLSEATDGISIEQLNNVFHDIILAIGGVFYAYPVPDDAVWKVAQSLDQIFCKVLPYGEEASDAEGESLLNSQGRKHPAIVELLRKLKT